MRKENTAFVSFETWGVYPILLLPLAFFLIVFAASIYIKHVMGMAVSGIFSLSLLLGSIARIEVKSDGIVVKRMVFPTTVWSFDDVRFKAAGRVLTYGGIYGGWVMPLNWKKCFDAIKTSTREGISVHKTPTKIRPYIYLLAPPFMLWIFTNLAHYFELAISPLLWASLWGVITALSITAFMYTAPIKFKIANSGKSASSIILGATIGIIVGTIVFLSYL